MIIYHGSLECVSSPEIREPNRRLDYGSGFYATTSYEQARRWVVRKMKENKVSEGYVNVYEFNEEAMTILNTLSFLEPTNEWVDFVMDNRTKSDFIHNYDIVYGPVANDRVYAAFALYEGRLITKEGLISELRTYELVDQYLFHTAKSLEYLKFAQVKKVTL